jgi:hypothetical protein
MSSDSSSFKELAPRLIAIYASVVDAESAIYCSTPITTGRRYVDWLLRHGLDFSSIDDAPLPLRADHMRYVVEHNVRHAAEVSGRIRSAHRRAVIDPAAIPHIEGWRQDDWLSFWEDVIDRFAQSLVFVDGWEYSLGCTHEYAYALSRNKPCFDERLTDLRVGRGIDLIGAACETMTQLGGNAAKLRRNLQTVMGLVPLEKFELFRDD